MANDASRLRRRVDGPIGRIELARPEEKNALDRATLEGLAEAAAWFDGQPGVKVVIVAAEGTSFSSGFDLSDPTWRELGPPERSGVTGRAMADAISSMSAVTIASIRGHCVGGGVVLDNAPTGLRGSSPSGARTFGHHRNGLGLLVPVQVALMRVA